MIIYIILLGLLCLWGISVPLIPSRRPADGAPFYTDYLSVEKTNAIKGVFIIIVVFNHALSYLTLSSSLLDKSFDFIITIIGQSVVAPFLFYSGYGVMLSIEKKGQAYVRGIPTKRVLRVLLHFDIAVLLFFVMNACIGKHFPLKQTLLSLTGWESVGNSNWYIFVILCMYLVTCMAFMLFREKRRLGLVAVAVLSFGLMVLLRQFKSIWWYDTVPCYALGMVWYYVHEKAERLLFKKKLLYYAVTGLLLGLCFVFIFVLKGTVFTILRHMTFVLALVLLTMRISICNKVLVFFGKHLFAIYILQRIPMIVMMYCGFTNPYLFLLIALAVTVALAVPFDWLLGKLDGLLFGKKPKKQPA